MKLVESNFLLENSKEMLDIINDFYIKSLEEKEISIVLQLKIKHFLEDIKSAFDYAAFFIYKKYCINHIKAKPEDHERNVCFPVKFSEKKFNTFLKNTFPKLEENNPQIIKIIKGVQPFLPDNPEWYVTFNSLVNKNKHRYLTPQTKEQKTMIRMFDEKGKTLSHFEHGGIRANNSFDIKVDGADWDQNNQLPIPNKNLGYEATTWIRFIFTELGLDVLQTLKEIQLKAEQIINELEIAI